MNVAKIGNTNLPLWFQYYPSRRVKVEVIETILARKYITYDYDKTDITFIWNLENTTKTYHDFFNNLFINKTVTTFTDYDGNIWNVLLMKFESKEERGVYSLSGELVVVSV